jgi:hypothetical protein
MKRNVSVVCVCRAPNCCDTVKLLDMLGLVASGTPCTSPPIHFIYPFLHFSFLQFTLPHITSLQLISFHFTSLTFLHFTSPPLRFTFTSLHSTKSLKSSVVFQVVLTNIVQHKVLIILNVVTSFSFVPRMLF